MYGLRLALAMCVCASALFSATFGTPVALVGGASDLVLDEPRGRLYLVNSSQSRVEVYSIPQRRFLTPIPTDSTPISCAIARNGRSLYVTSYNASSLNVIDLNTLTLSNRVSLPARPEGVAVGGDERVLITTIGTGVGNAANVLLLFDPDAQNAEASLTSIAVTPPAPTPPQLPPPSGRPFLQSRSQLATSLDGRFIVGVNLPNATTRTVFVYEVVSATVLRSRSVASASSVLAVSPDGSKFMAGLTLFDSETLQVIAQQNLANSPYPIAPGTNFNVQSAQGGSVFSPDGATLYSGFDISPVQNPPARANIAELMLSDPDNLLITLGLQMPENLAGKLVITRDGGTIYALSESGFVIIPISTMNQFPIAVPEVNVGLLANDQCGVTSAQRTTRVTVRNAGRGAMTATAQVLQFAATGPGGIGGGAGGGNPGGGIVIIVPPIVTPGPTPTPGPIVPGGGGQQNVSILQTAPTIRPVQTPQGPAFDFTFSSFAARGIGTTSPAHDILIQSPQAINIPQRVRVYQNNRHSESRGEIIPVPTGISDNEALTDLTYDARRQRLYITNSGLNRLEVFDIRSRQFMQPVKVGQLPRSMALTPDGNTLYVVNTGGESISIIDPETMRVVDKVMFPPIPLNTAAAIITPSVIAASQRGAMFMTSTGQLWRIIGNEAVPRGVSSIIGADAQGRPLTIAAPRGLASTPNGERIIVTAGNGNSYLYDALADDFIQGRQVYTGRQIGFVGPVAAGPRGTYFLVNGYLLNEALTPVGSPPASGGGGTTATTPIPVAAVAPAGTTTFARLVQTARAANAVATDAGTIEIVDAATGATVRSAPVLEGPLTQITTNATAAIDSRIMAVDATGSTAYLLTESGLSIIPLDTVPLADRPQIATRGVVNAASYQVGAAQNGLVSIFGRNLGSLEQASNVPLPTVLGGVCVTLNNSPLPLIVASNGQINAQIPPTLAAGNYPLIVRSLDRKLASVQTTLTISKYSPAVLVETTTNQIALFHKDGRPVTKQNPAKRDEPLTMYALGLGPTKGGPVTPGMPSPSSPLAVTDPVQVFFGNPLIKEAGIIVDWSGLTPGFIGLYQLNLRVPGDHLRGEALPVTIKIGNISSPTTGPVVPTVAVD
jgi:uncharacterized protein (TIGR03437 family)